MSYIETQEGAEMMAYLTEELGVESREAEIILRDGDLFPLIEAGSMVPFEGEQAVAQWEDATDKLRTLAVSTLNEEFFDNPALAQSFLEAAERAEAMLKRARERVEASAG